MSETAVERRLRVVVNDARMDAVMIDDDEIAAIDAGREAIRLLRSIPRKRGCPWCGTVWTSLPACCPLDDKRRALLARCEGETR